MIRSKATTRVVLGTFFLALTLACASEPDSGQSWICEDSSGIRLPDEDCPEDDDGGGGYVGYKGKRKYYDNSASISAVGQRVPTGGSYTRPSGSVGGFPAKGGFGGTGGSSGS